MTISSWSFRQLVSVLKERRKTCTVVEQCCGGVINSSILAQPGASAVYYGGSVVYNTQKSQKLLLDNSELYATIVAATSRREAPDVPSPTEAYIHSKFTWTALTSVAFCEALQTDFAIAEGGAAGPTFAIDDLSTGFAVVAIAGRDESGRVSVLSQNLIHSDSANRERNMRYFADAAADMATEVVTGRAQVSEKRVASDKKLIQLNRATHLRADEATVQQLAIKGRYVIVTDKNILVQSPTQPAFLNHEEVLRIGGGQRRSFLGLLSVDDTPIFSVDLLDETISKAPPYGHTFVDTRSTVPLFSDMHNSLALHATALAQWQRRSRYCNLCGGTTTLVEEGNSCQCTMCQSKSWPRQDPSMIALIQSRDCERVLLARSPRHPPKVHTVLAGFVEAGETFEAAVAREAYEETGASVDCSSIHYVGSQSWPFPQSCMIGFIATADDQIPLNIDTKELVSAAWFGKDDVRKAATILGSTMQDDVAAAAVENDPTLKLLIPPKGVIARTLIDKWLGQE